MIYELRTYTLRPGAQPLVAGNAGTVAREIRGDNYGKLEGYWLTEHGALNQVMHLWSFDSFDERQRLRAALGQNERWVNEYLPLILPHLVRQDIRLMEAVLPLKAPPGENNLYEYRNYRTAPGKARQWAKGFQDIMPVREGYSPNVCAWITDAGQPNEVSHLWAYPSLDARLEIRAKVAADPQWKEFLKTSGSLLEEMHSTVMLPAAHSPLR
ncbi:MAG: hypothetical protein ACI8PT_000600 [Gammaproteobacteria bacterium]|jgi:hypothetical protein